MKRILTLTLAGLVALALAAGCTEDAPETQQSAAQPAAKEAPAAAEQAAKGISGTVVETMDTGGYTYVQVDTGEKKVWAAAPQFTVKVGDPVVIPEGMPMENYHSKTLDRDFDLVYFVDSVMVGGADAMQSAEQMPADHPDVGTPNDRIKVEATDVDLAGLEKPEGGTTVAEVYSEKADLEGKKVTIRAKVVKFSPEIMGTNWLHLQDGTGEAGSNDLTVTTDKVAKVGDTVLVKGKVTADKDFGYGYKYDVILEDAEVTVE